MGLRASLVGPEARAWATALGRAPHDFYHLPGYVRVSARHDGGEPCAVVVDDGDRGLLLPLVIRQVEGGGGDARSPYGYPGPLAIGRPDPAFEGEALLAAVGVLEEIGVVSLFIRMHPLLNPEPPAGVGTCVRHGDTVSVDLTLPETVQWHQIRRNHRQQIRQALEAGYVASIDHEWRHGQDFKALYRSTMQHCAAHAYYSFDDVYFEELRQALGETLRIAVVMKDGVVAAAGLFVETGGIVQMHLTGQDDRFLADHPMKLGFHHVRTWCSERGDRVLHLGGGRGGAEDSLFHFKAGFSPLRHPFHTLRVVIREAEYAKLVAARDPSLDPQDLTGPFPLYAQG
jgi:hypothetical protein